MYCNIGLHSATILVSMHTPVVEFFKFRRDFLLRLVVIIVGAHGLFIIATTLLEQTELHSGLHASDFTVDVPLLLGMGLFYLSTLLQRRKQTAWVAAVAAYVFMLGFYSSRINYGYDEDHWLQVFGKLILPLAIIGLLILYRSSFTVRSDIQSFRYSLRVTVLVLLVTFAYGTSGFLLMDEHDFHEEISVSEAAHHTVDQFDLTTDHVLVPHTKRAHLFVDSLSVVSIGALVYAVTSLFQPIRARYYSQYDTRENAEKIMGDHPGKSEDFFKLWPHDKSYFFDKAHTAGLAYHVKRRVALVVGDPFGDRTAGRRLVEDFQDECFSNDWLPAYIHTEPDWSKTYKKIGYNLQKLGEEAVVNLQNFNDNVRGDKYFRQIGNKFRREGYTSEILLPPHSKALVGRLQTISDEWLELPGRSERGFMMGYFSLEYLEQGPVIVARDSAGTIQAFLNQIPSYDLDEANFDMLRHSKQALGNVNDFVIMAFIDHLVADDTLRLNMGLCPLSGLDDSEEKSLVNTTLRFVYANGDRFYSFSGLRRFKDKYKPDWSDRYVAYPGSAANFVRVMNALNRAMRVK